MLPSFPTWRDRRSGIAISRFPAFPTLSAYILRLCDLSGISRNPAGSTKLGEESSIVRWRTLRAALTQPANEAAADAHYRPSWIRTQKRAAPHKRSMVAWRRRPIPRVMQYPRQNVSGWHAKRFNASGAILDQIRMLKRRACRNRIFSTAGWSSRLFPAVGDPAVWPHAAGSSCTVEPVLPVPAC